METDGLMHQLLEIMQIGKVVNCSRKHSIDTVAYNGLEFLEIELLTVRDVVCSLIQVELGLGLDVGLCKCGLE